MTYIMHALFGMVTCRKLRGTLLYDLHCLITKKRPEWIVMHAIDIVTTPFDFNLAK